ncbi:hypothetical protein COLO4_20522 [Corchorus olitorius]|uniref:Rad60/SUMO-like domain-containing protein n=1 Tax=Corchorus olitorius TaxID=93759 RepID=A0A1R3IZC7_9ROSI|nr:hypothetical protein COLO4_20522 [Corchorus olitorius]
MSQQRAGENIDMSLQHFGGAQKSTLITLVQGHGEIGEQIFLQVQGIHDYYCFWMFPMSRLDDLMRNYAQCADLPLNSLRFHYNGDEIQHPSLTPNCLKMKNGDTINVTQWLPTRVMIDSRTFIESPNRIVLPCGDEEKPIYLQVVVNGKTIDDKVNYCIGRNTPLDCLLLDFAARFYEFYNHTIMFRTSVHLRPVRKEDTADNIMLEDGDMILMWTTMPSSVDV